jgi:very-short-patch-repair endonuclease
LWDEYVRPQVTKKLLQNWGKTTIDEICDVKGWRPHSKEEIRDNDEEGYIGCGEKQLVAALTIAEVPFWHQVQIEPYYTADFVCFNPHSGKICVVELDGHQHWSDPGQSSRDEKRMAGLAAKGVPTIRFINMFAKNRPQACVSHIQSLLDFCMDENLG